jgi:hypothetical protein
MGDMRHRPTSGLACVVAGLVLAAAGLVLSACERSSAIRPEVLQRWVGRPASALEKDWGPATREVTDSGQRVLIYEELDRARQDIDTRGGGTSARTMESPVQRQANITAYGLKVYARSYLFWVDASGTIVRTEVQGAQ